MPHKHREQAVIAVERIPPDETGVGFLRIVQLGLTGEKDAGYMVPLGRSGVDPATVSAQLGAALARALPEEWLGFDKPRPVAEPISDDLSQSEIDRELAASCHLRPSRVFLLACEAIEATATDLEHVSVCGICRRAFNGYQESTIESPPPEKPEDIRHLVKPFREIPQTDIPGESSG